MSETTSPTELTSQYTAQVSADLERNTKEQERIGAEIAALQEQLTALQRDHQVLVGIQQVIDTAPPSARSEPAAAADNAAVPAPRTETATTPGTGTRKRTKAKKTGSAARRSPAKKPATAPPAAKKPTTAPSAAKSDTAKTKQTKLVDLVRGHLAEQSEPRSAAEIATALGQAHPDRSIKTTVIRTTLEGLVARTQAQRTKQGSSVYYTAPETPEKATSKQTEEAASAEA
ncbi:hypothetical protein [Streptomyces cellulosae]|uniref:hypothetical protein n=1 Tax=Streptomyces cellulosae TaxID=1968 RepID=UPI0004C523DC|nr:hypothetical protein [Streptomyces cellulosae]